MIALRSSIFSLALCSLFASSLVRADDCGDALIAESCACRSLVGSGREQIRRSDKGSRSDRPSETRHSTKTHVGQRERGSLRLTKVTSHR
jgi:hypothetical protein